jgi:hypothetical protein
MKIVEGMKFLTRRRFYDLALAPRYVSPARRAFSSGLAPFSPNIVTILFSTGGTHVAKQMQSAGLAGARMLGEKKVASLLLFSWPTRHDGNSKPAAKGKTKSGNDKPISGRRRRKTG